MIQRVSNVDFQQWELLASAITKLMCTGRYKEFVGYHEQHTMHIHGKHLFLPWHRAYLVLFETDLRQINGSLSIPYWDWIADGGELLGFDHLPKLPGVMRPSNKPFFTDKNKLAEISDSPDFDTFTSTLEHGPHDSGHNWMGGLLSDTQTSPKDPAFWLHHAQVDRLWSLWQEHHNYDPSTHPQPQTDPLNLDGFTVADMNNISELDGGRSYEYL